MSASDDFSNSNSLVPTEMATCCERKEVFITVYVEKPWRRASTNRRRLHQSIKHELIGHKHRGIGKGYDRRTELLYYSQSLRESARSSASAVSQYSKPVSSSHHQQTSNKIKAVERKAKYSKSVACFDKWRMVVPSCFRSLTNHQTKKTGKRNNGGSSYNKIKAVMKSPQMQKKWSFLSKPISILCKNRHR